MNEIDKSNYDYVLKEGFHLTLFSKVICFDTIKEDLNFLSLKLFEFDKFSVHEFDRDEIFSGDWFRIANTVTRSIHYIELFSLKEDLSDRWKFYETYHPELNREKIESERKRINKSSKLILNRTLEEVGIYHDNVIVPKTLEKISFDLLFKLIMGQCGTIKSGEKFNKLILNL